jgi:hypothetical protein
MLISLFLGICLKGSSQKLDRLHNKTIVSKDTLTITYFPLEIDSSTFITTKYINNKLIEIRFVNNGTKNSVYTIKRFSKFSFASEEYYQDKTKSINEYAKNVFLEYKEIEIKDSVIITFDFFDNGNIKNISLEDRHRKIYGFDFFKLDNSYECGYYKNVTLIDTLKEKQNGNAETLVLREYSNRKYGKWERYNSIGEFKNEKTYNFKNEYR